MKRPTMYTRFCYAQLTYKQHYSTIKKPDSDDTPDMKKILLLALLVLGIVRSQATSRQLGSLLTDLDKTITAKSTFTQTKEERLKELQESLYNSTPQEKLDIVQRLYNEYNTYCADSAMHYSFEMSRLAIQLHDWQSYYQAEIYRARTLVMQRQFLEASEILEELSTKQMSEQVYRSFLLCKLRICNLQRDYAINGPERERFSNQANELRELILRDTVAMPHSSYLTTRAEHLLANLHYEDVLSELIPYCNTLPARDKNMGKTAYRIGSALYALGRQEEAMAYFARSAIADISNSVREYTSLRRLATMLYENGDLDRAYNYMRCAMDDAIACDARLRSLEASEMFYVIDQSYQAKETNRRQQLTRLLILICILTAIILATLIYIAAQNRKLRAVRDKLALSNVSLRESIDKLYDANKIKEEYIGQYMEQYSGYLLLLRSFKNKARKILRTEGANRLAEYIENMFGMEKEFEEFYQRFDQTVLKLFPDFIDRFNELLAEGEQIRVKNEGELTPELRIFALIRLGICDSVKIAHFLNYSLSTIYNYRTKMRNKARGERENFEREVMMIGIKI